MNDIDSTIDQRREMLVDNMLRLRKHDTIFKAVWRTVFENSALYITLANSSSWNYQIVFMDMQERESLVVSIVDYNLGNCRNIDVNGEDRYNPFYVAKIIIASTDI